MLKQLVCKCYFISVSCLVLVFVPSAESSLTVTLNNFRVAAADNGFNSETYGGTNIPDSKALLAEFGASRSRSQSNWNITNGRTLLDFSFDLGRAQGSIGVASWARAQNNEMVFTASNNATYDAIGEFGFTHSTDGERIEFTARLRDITAGETLFFSSQRSYATNGDRFLLGGLGGDSRNYAFGNLRGRLVAGHEYGFYFDALISGRTLDHTDGANAAGAISLIVSPAAVPEPLSCLTWGGLGLFIGLTGRQRRRSS